MAIDSSLDTSLSGEVGVEPILDRAVGDRDSEMGLPVPLGPLAMGQWPWVTSSGPSTLPSKARRSCSGK